MTLPRVILNSYQMGRSRIKCGMTPLRVILNNRRVILNSVQDLNHCSGQ